MIVDAETFQELTRHLERVSRGVLHTAQQLVAVSTNTPTDDEQWTTLTDHLMAIVMELIVVDKLVTAVLEANRAEGIPAERSARS